MGKVFVIELSFDPKRNDCEVISENKNTISLLCVCVFFFPGKIRVS